MPLAVFSKIDLKQQVKIEEDFEWMFIPFNKDYIKEVFYQNDSLIKKYGEYLNNKYGYDTYKTIKDKYDYIRIEVFDTDFETGKRKLLSLIKKYENKGYTLLYSAKRTTYGHDATSIYWKYGGEFVAYLVKEK